MASSFDPYQEWLGIPPHEQPPNHYRLLNIRPFENIPGVIREAVDERTIHLKQFVLSKYGVQTQRLLNEVAAAWVCLSDEEKKGEYDKQLREKLQVKSVRARPKRAAPKVGRRLPASQPQTREKATPTSGLTPQVKIGVIGGAVGLVLLIGGLVLLMSGGSETAPPETEPSKAEMYLLALDWPEDERTGATVRPSREANTAPSSQGTDPAAPPATPPIPAADAESSAEQPYVEPGLSASDGSAPPSGPAPSTAPGSGPGMNQGPAMPGAPGGNLPPVRGVDGSLVQEIILPTGTEWNPDIFEIDPSKLNRLLADLEAGRTSVFDTLHNSLFKYAVYRYRENNKGNFVLDGLATAFHEDDELVYYAEYSENGLNGLMMTWSPKGEPIYCGEYRKDEREGLCCLFQDDSLRIVSEYDDDNLLACALIVGGKPKSYSNEQARENQIVQELLALMDDIQRDATREYKRILIGRLVADRRETEKDVREGRAARLHRVKHIENIKRANARRAGIMQEILIKKRMAGH